MQGGRNMPIECVGGDHALALYDHRRRSTSNVKKHSQRSQSEQWSTSSHHPDVKGKTRLKFQPKRFHLQDPAWGHVQKTGPTETDLQTISKRFDSLGLQKTVSEQVAMIPPSSARFDWFYNNAERKARKCVLKSRLRKEQTKTDAVMDHATLRSKEFGEEVAKEAAELQQKRVFEMTPGSLTPGVLELRRNSS